ncbi:uncharacterized protein NECHADRAFT_75769 [Fusarium vanettenii 77-13-4]|uniref:tyrosinase n=1 Tax=Fusarium vanettenii (strain ATCC MYA-4622 / CBS 123669 / FGSC 9596 / NRRL 45880 / 77-13-4) TaxID=660122 RepID=C7YJR3_FUSV7|nr:uncharacterized protein NECHADRAFT_75769 [Fusarium vanettenii 77-13-4]EEU49020.1 hypothetical protein NECHADRAFT_75769 [Fusarium vanettenii 77-13-4]
MADPPKPGVSFGITGIPAENVEHRTKDIPYAPGMPLRREISALAKAKKPEDQRQWTLYVLALERFKNLPVDDKLSYFQVAGIHAYPQLTWDDGEPSKKSRFYCTHGELTFSTWHRIYMLLFEQLVWKHMKAIIEEWKLDKADLYEERKVYPNPFYGFDNPENDEQTGDPLPFGKMPKGKEKYNISDRQKHDGEPVATKPASKEVLPWSLTNSTGRWGIQIKPGKMYTGLDGVNNFMTANRFFGASVIGRVAPRWVIQNPGNLSDKLNRILTSRRLTETEPDPNYTWGLFASKKWTKEHRKRSNLFSSIEAIHDTVHGVTDGTEFETGVGHMSDVPVAVIELETLLGYRYDDLVPQPDAVKEDGYLDEEHYKIDLKAYINSTYPGPALAISKIRGPGIETPDGLSDRKGAPFPDYVINVVYDRFALGETSYSIKFWLGGPSNEPQTNEVEENYIGQVLTFTGSFSNTGGCENCKRQADHIFDKAKDHPIENLTDKEVEEYLKLHLGWTYVQHVGRKLKPEKFPKTEISVMKGQGVPQYTEPEQKLEAELVSIASMPVASLNALPVNPVANLSQATIDEPNSRVLPPAYSNYELIYDATDGKTGGLSRPS